MDLIPGNLIDEQDWCTSIIHNLIQPSSTVTAKELKVFVLVNGKLYFRGSDRVLARALSMRD